MRTTWTALLLAVAGCGESGDDGVVRRDGQPDFVVKFDKRRMDAAIAEAKETFGDFEKAIDARRPGTSGFTLKKGFATASGSTEFIWISDVVRKGDAFEGTVGNEPVDVPGLKVDQVVPVARPDVVDWMYRDGTQSYGGYTIVALVYGTKDQKAYEEKMGFKDWSRYRFLNLKTP